MTSPLRVLLLLVVSQSIAGFSLVQISSQPNSVARRTAPPPVALAARSKEAEANIKKWGKILSQADTFDDTIKLKNKKGAPPKDTRAGASLVLAGSGAAVIAMIIASVGQ